MRKILLFLLFPLLLTCDTTEQFKTNSSPNLFLFLADDLSYTDIGVNGNPHTKTITIDAFTNKAISFERMYTPSAMCAPSRSALMTGLYPHRNGCHNNHGSIDQSVKSLPSYLKALGYQVALVGKRHIKPLENFPYDYLKFDELASYFEKAEQPVCVIYASNEPHGPHAESTQSLDEVLLPPKWVDTKSTREKLTGYYADIATLDMEFKAFLQTIQQNGLDKNAITIFTSDHGYEYFAKWTCYEAGLRVPFYMQTNGIVFDAKKIESLTSFIDVVPTFVELAGGESPQEIDGKSWLPLLNNTQTSTHQFIYGSHTTRGIYSGKVYPIRSITDGKWKYIRNLNPSEKFQNIITNGWNFDPPPTEGSWAEWLAVLEKEEEGAKWAAFYQKRPAEELYNLENDPDEKINLAEEAAHQNIKVTLNQELNRWMKAQNDTGMIAEMKVPLKAKDKSKVPEE